MGGRLKDRLARLREIGVARSNREPARVPYLESSPEAAPAGWIRNGTALTGPGGATRPTFLEGWDALGDLVWTREVGFSLAFPETIDPAPYRSAGKGLSGLYRGSGGTAYDAQRIRREDIRFFDFETSGLSGGTGTVAFLAASGRFEGERYLVRQFFLEDYPGELAFVEAIVAELAGRNLVVATYNGASFDLPLLRTRCVMNGIRPPELRGIDALPCARRLWRTVCGGASLGLVERAILGIDRGEDVPGCAIPGAWFEYLRCGDHPLMPLIVSHNASDVMSLASLAGRIEKTFAKPLEYAESAAVDRAALGRGLLRMGRDAEGERLLEAAAEAGEERAALLLSRRFGRQGRLADRERVIGLLPETFESCVERAKFHEHAMRDFARALHWARTARAQATGERELEDLLVRMARLERKAATQKRGGPRPQIM